jgi:hypothetical protein
MGRAALQKAADEFAANTLPIVRQLQAQGVRSLRKLAEALNERHVPTARGGTWQAVQVRNLLRRS